MKIFLIVLALAVVVTVQYVLSVEFYDAAVLKGYKEKKYFWYGFLFGVVGFLLIIALPDRNNTNNSSQPFSADELPEI